MDDSIAYELVLVRNAEIHIGGISVDYNGPDSSYPAFPTLTSDVQISKRLAHSCHRLFSSWHANRRSSSVAIGPVTSNLAFLDQYPSPLRHGLS